MLRVGLTGGIGSGKSEVSRLLAAHGAVVLDADVAARKVVEPGTPGLARIAEAFGPGVLRPDGSLDRERLAAIVFNDPGQLATLNAIVHPLVRQWMRTAEVAAMAPADDAEASAGSAAAPAGDVEGLAGATSGDGASDSGSGSGSGSGSTGPAGDGMGSGESGKKHARSTMVVHDVPLLAEAGLAGSYDLVVVVDVPPDTQLERLVRNRGMSAEQARGRIAAQATREQRLAVADIVIENSGSLAELTAHVDEAWSELSRRAAGG